jgi:hypothetical protein
MDVNIWSRYHPPRIFWSLSNEILWPHSVESSSYFRLIELISWVLFSPIASQMGFCSCMFSHNRGFIFETFSIRGIRTLRIYRLCQKKLTRLLDFVNCPELYITRKERFWNWLSDLGYFFLRGPIEHVPLPLAWRWTRIQFPKHCVF